MLVCGICGTSWDDIKHQHVCLRKRTIGAPVTDETAYREFIPTIAAEDTERVLQKDKEYGASWKRRGGVGAYMVMIRKVDRLEEQCKKHGYDIFKACRDTSTGEGLLDTIRDLRSYLDLIEAEVRATGL